MKSRLPIQYVALAEDLSNVETRDIYTETVSPYSHIFMALDIL